MKPFAFRCLLGAALLISMISWVNAQSVSSPRLRQSDSLPVTASVDRRVELMSIIARLAGYDEYVNNNFKVYADDVDSYFQKFKQHPAIKLATKVRQSNGVAFDAVMKMAVHLNPPPALTPRVPFTNEIPDPRWSKLDAEQFADLLQQFYKEADCEHFFQSHADLYQTVERRFQLLTNKVDFEWYRRFYGEVPRGEFHLYIGLLNGGGNYGPKVVHPDAKEELYAIIGTWQVDGSGLPMYSDADLPTIIHEYNHSFINPLVLEHERQLSIAGERIFATVAEKMRLLAYGTWQNVLNESLVRAAVIRYQSDHSAPPAETDHAVIAERNLGFFWCQDLYVLLGVYESSRNHCPTLHSFFPLIVGYFNDFSQRAEYTARLFEESSPHVLSLSPFNNGAHDVDPSITLLTITFDKPLDPTGGYSFNPGAGGGEHYPIEKCLGYEVGGGKFSVQVKLKPDWDYEFVLIGRAFKTRDGYPLTPFTVKFRTRKL